MSLKKKMLKTKKDHTGILLYLYFFTFSFNIVNKKTAFKKILSSRIRIILNLRITCRRRHLTSACLFWIFSCTVTFSPFQSPVALAISSPIFLGDRPRGPTCPHVKSSHKKKQIAFTKITKIPALG